MRNKDTGEAKRMRVPQTTTTSDHKVYFKGHAFITQKVADQIGAAIERKRQEAEAPVAESAEDMEARIRTEVEERLRAEGTPFRQVARATKA